MITRSAPRYLWPSDHQRDLPSFQARERRSADQAREEAHRAGAPTDLGGFLRWCAEKAAGERL